MKPGETFLDEGKIVCNQGRPTTTLIVRNASDHFVFVSSHYHFFEANKRLVFDRGAAFGMRLDVPAGETVLWQPGEAKEIRLVGLAGAKQAWGFNGLANGPLSDSQKSLALRRAREKGFLSEAGER